jgi:cytochrome c oxidase accessory protein FixG
VLYDADTINVGYDRARGEPRGRVGTAGAGDCVDCFRCVQVCPTGIDIRNGTQLECVGCANCIDACDEVMDRLGRPRGLVRYDSQAGFEGGARRFLRPRLALYGVLLAAGAAVFAAAASGREAFEANLQRLQASPYTLEGDVVTNAFTLHLENKQPVADTFALEAAEREGIELVIPSRTVQLESLADQRVPIFVRIDRAHYRRGLRLDLTVRAAGETRRLSAPLLGPGGGVR